jgi:hypothetical protein
LTGVAEGEYAARVKSGKPSGSPDLAFKVIESAAYPDEEEGVLMGWLDKLLGRDKQDAGEPATAPTSTAGTGDEPAGMAEEPGHEGHGHPPGEHPHEEHP